MKKSKEQIIKEINNLLIELASFGDKSHISISKSETKTSSQLTGCIGVLQQLIDENFFAELKKIEDVLVKLEEEGKPYSRELVSMNLLNLVRKTTLRRLKRDNKWHYIVRN